MHSHRTGAQSAWCKPPMFKLLRDHKELPVSSSLKQDKVTREKMLWGQSTSAQEEAPKATSVLAPQCPSGQVCSPQ